MSGSSIILKRREFVTQAAMLFLSGAILHACDDELDLDGCADEPDMAGAGCPEPAELEPVARAPEALPADPDDLLFLRSFE